jgi:hypothetical protein
MSDRPAHRRVIASTLFCVTAIACWYAFVFSPQRQVLRHVLERAAVEMRETEAIDGTLAHAAAIRRARSQVLARLSGENRSQRYAIAQTLTLLDRNARMQSVSILSIVPANVSAGNATLRSPVGAVTDDPIDLSISVEGTFEATMRFLEAASSSIEPLAIGDVRLNAERSDGKKERLLAQIDARVYHFMMPK